jgi:hypothetical protein
MYNIVEIVHDENQYYHEMVHYYVIIINDPKQIFIFKQTNKFVIFPIKPQLNEEFLEN